MFLFFICIINLTSCGNKYKLSVSTIIKIKVKIVDEQGVILNKFDTIKSCEDFLGIYPTLAKTSLVRLKAVVSKGKICFVKEIFWCKPYSHPTKNSSLSLILNVCIRRVY